MKSIISILTLLTIVTLIQTMNAQSGSINGKLVYMDGSDYYNSGGSDVRLYQYGYEIQSTKTNSRGEFSFERLNAGDYTVIAFYKVTIKTGKGKEADQLLNDLLSSFTRSEQAVSVAPNRSSYVRIRIGER